MACPWQGRGPRLLLLGKVAAGGPSDGRTKAWCLCCSVPVPGWKDTSKGGGSWRGQSDSTPNTMVTTTIWHYLSIPLQSLTCALSVGVTCHVMFQFEGFLGGSYSFVPHQPWPQGATMPRKCLGVAERCTFAISIALQQFRLPSPSSSGGITLSHNGNVLILGYCHLGAAEQNYSLFVFACDIWAAGTWWGGRFFFCEWLKMMMMIWRVKHSTYFSVSLVYKIA